MNLFVNTVPILLKVLVLFLLGVIAMHLETLDLVHQESKRLPPIPKVQHMFIILIQLHAAVSLYIVMLWLMQGDLADVGFGNLTVVNSLSMNALLNLMII